MFRSARLFGALALGLAGMAVATSDAWAQSASGSGSDLQAAAQNPIASLISVPFRTISSSARASATSRSSC